MNEPDGGFPLDALPETTYTRQRLRREKYLNEHGDRIFAQARLLLERGKPTPPPGRPSRWNDNLNLRRNSSDAH